MKRFSVAVATLLITLSTQSVLRAEGETITPDVIYGHKAGMALTYDVVKPAEPNGAAVLFIMSGGWVSTWFPPEFVVRKQREDQNQFELLTDNGYTLFIVRHGSSPYFKVPDAVSDVLRAVRFIRLHAEDYGIDPERIGVFGMSAGGHLSLMLSTTADDGAKGSDLPVEKTSNRVQAVVAICPPTNLNNFFKLKADFPALDFPTEEGDDVSPLLHVSDDDSPTLLIHGDKDDLVPIKESELIVDEFKKKSVPTNLVVIEGAGHGFGPEDQIKVQTATLEWFNKHLKPKM
ncbi:alpha/beta hydrolase [Planctomicrobium sp. SH668]|uniref:alpha/beta hydrolase n=1 Tax=Planctomicrobium sp. SH668 TaxID=3448126 RepID=UPI003F5B707E